MVAFKKKYSPNHIGKQVEHKKQISEKLRNILRKIF